MKTKDNLVLTLDEFLRRGEGRCQECGAHPRKQQGHTTTCPTKGNR